MELRDLGFDGVDPAAIGRPTYHPSPMLKLYIYGYLNRAQSSRRLEREAGRNFEVMWLTGRLAPDHKTIADFRKDNGPAIKNVCARFVELCRKMGLLAKRDRAVASPMHRRADANSTMRRCRARSRSRHAPKETRCRTVRARWPKIIGIVGTICELAIWFRSPGCKSSAGRPFPHRPPSSLAEVCDDHSFDYPFV